jgi:hypothetical protein
VSRMMRRRRRRQYGASSSMALSVAWLSASNGRRS